MLSERFSVLISDDHPLVRHGIKHVVDSDERLTIAGEASSGMEAAEAYRRLRPDVVLMDLNMPESSGLEGINRIREADRDARIVILTSFDGEEDIFAGLRSGARGYILKDAPVRDLVDCILLVARGGRYVPSTIAARLANRMGFTALSERELDILNLMVNGASNKQIARRAGITEGTVKFHVTNILSKMAVESRTEAVTAAVRRGLVRLN
jgi:two-component system NarL family response regulator